MSSRTLFGTSLALAASLAQAQRTLTFVNNCASDAQLSATAGADSTGAYYDNPDPTNGYTVTANGGTTAITYPDHGDGTFWSGNHRVWMGDSSACTSGASPYAGCQVTAPASEAEYTFLTSGVDTYDLSNINGINVPMQVAPDTPTYDSSNVYQCGIAGGPDPTTGVGNASWALTPPSDAYQYAASVSGSCSDNSDCSSGVCAWTFTAGVGVQQGCGDLLAYWTMDELCSLDTGSVALNCSAPITDGSISTTMGDFSGCNAASGTAPGSCYQSDADDTCCGCVNWQDELASGLVPNSTGTCVSSSPEWTQYIQPTIEWIKEAVPTAYTYPYDDFSSTFTCPVGTDYTITLCPSGTTMFGSSGSSKRSLERSLEPPTKLSVAPAAKRFEPMVRRAGKAERRTWNRRAL